MMDERIRTLLVETEGLEKDEKWQGIVLGKSVCGAVDYGTVLDENEVALDVVAYWSIAFEKLVSLIGDPNIEDMIFYILENNLIKETSEFMGGTNVLLELADADTDIVKKINFSLVCILDEDNKVTLIEDSNIEEICNIMPEEHRSVFKVQYAGLKMMHSRCYSRQFCDWWEQFIQFIFTDPGECKRLINEALTEYES